SSCLSSARRAPSGAIPRRIQRPRAEHRLNGSTVPAAELSQILVVRRKDDRTRAFVRLESPPIALHCAVEVVEIRVLVIGVRIDARGFRFRFGADDLCVALASGADRFGFLLPI